MTGPDAPWYDMPGSPSTGWLRREPDEPLLDMIVAGLPLPPAAPQDMIALASGLDELARPAGPGELAGEADALAAYSAMVSPAGVSRGRASTVGSAAHGRTHARRGSRRPVPVRARLAAAITFGGIVVSGTAAAYAGVLPAPVQELAHRIIGAPPAHEGSGHQPTGSHGGATSGQARGHHGATPASRGKGIHGTKAVRGQHSKGKAKGKNTRGQSKGHTHSSHPTPAASASPSPKPPGHGHLRRPVGRA